MLLLIREYGTPPQEVGSGGTQSHRCFHPIIVEVLTVARATGVREIGLGEGEVGL